MSIVQNNLVIDLALLRELIITQWQSKNLYNYYFNYGLRGESLYECILNKISDYADILDNKLEEEARKKFNQPNAWLEWFSQYPKSDIRSIGFAVVDFLSQGSTFSIEELTYEDIPAILAFIDTPPDKALEGWAQWEHYWSTIDLPAQRKKLLEESSDQ